jgi:glycosyltransferase involved in cell wall biosynthesis
MKIFLVLSGIPYEDGEAIEVVSHEVVRLMAAAGHDLIVQVMIREGSSTHMEEQFSTSKEKLSEAGNIQLLPVLYLGDMQQKKSHFFNFIEYVTTIVRCLPPFTGLINKYFFPGMIAKKAVLVRVKEAAPDIILSIWSWEALSATYDIKGVPKFVYYGNSNHKPLESQMRFAELFDMPTQGLRNRLRFILYKLFNRARELQHLKMMAQCEVTANNSKVDAQYYKDAGHPHSIYLQNMWPEDIKGPIFGGRKTPDGSIRIAGSVGNLGATGNTFGLNYLGEKLVPELEKQKGSEELIINIYGGGEPRSKVKQVLKRDCIYLRGWVDDLVTELHHSHAFLVLTNVDGFIVGNTRTLLAWALGSCVVAHTNSTLAMPEIKHMENALLADTPEELAKLIIQVSHDDELRERIGRGGYKTFKKYYLSDVVIPRMLLAMDNCIINYKVSEVI